MFNSTIATVPYSIDTCSTQFMPGHIGMDFGTGDYSVEVRVPTHEIITVCQYCNREWTDPECPACGATMRKKIKVEIEGE
jgi:hypothetical protein